MRRLAFGLVAALVLFVASCAGTPREQFSQGQNIFLPAVTALNLARDTGKIDDDAWEIVQPIINEAWAAMREWDAATANGGDGSSFRMDFYEVYTRLQPYIIEWVAEEPSE